MADDTVFPPVLVLDNGTGYIKIGFSNESKPRYVIPTLVGRQMLREGSKVDCEMRMRMFGDEVIPCRALLDLTHPVQAGIIFQKDDLLDLWRYVLTQKMGIKEFKDLRVLVTEAPFTPIDNKKKILDILLNDIGVSMANIEAQAKLSIFSEGVETGMVIDSGDGVSHCIPIVAGHILHHFADKINIAGSDITKRLIQLLQFKGYAFNSTSDYELIREIKEKFCFVSSDYEKDKQLDRETTFYNTYYLLPDGERIRLSSEKFEAPEILFNPSLMGREECSLPEMVFKSIMKCPIETRRPLFGSLVLSGANTLFAGFTSRIENEVKTLYKKNVANEQTKGHSGMSFNVIDSYKRKYSVFIGGTVVANYYNNADSDEYWISQEEFNECGDQDELIKRKCQSYMSETG